jgi:cytochrome c biogenesis protein CcmG, thiol:disulfide interchange protein DsbE
MKKFLLIAWLLWLAGPCQAAGPEVGKAAPPLEARLLDGSRFTLAQSSGKVVIVNFWATWCVPCREEMPAMEAYYQKHHADGLEILAISMDRAEDAPKVAEAMRVFSFPAALARDAEIRGYGRIWRMPTTFIIDRQGMLRLDGGAGDAIKIDAALLEKEVSALLGAQ